MATPRSQSAQLRPIAFALHDTARNTPQEVFTLAIRPEDLVRTEPTNMSVVQTLGGAWADMAGAGLATCTIGGTTGWGAGGQPDGFEHFQALHKTVFEKYHQLRAEVVEAGKDPDGVKLIFSDGLDDFAWVVGPQSFTLRRNRARPLLSQYQISMVKLADDVVIEAEKPAASLSTVLSSLDSSIAKINSFADNIKGDIKAALGPLASGVKGALALTTTALTSVRKLTAAGNNVINSVFSPVLEIAQDMTKVSVNVMAISAAVKSMPLTAKRDIVEVKQALNNANCLLHNAISGPSTLPDYSSLYGASNCSSTAGGSSASAYADVNVFPLLYPATTSPVTQSAQAQAAVNTMAAADVLNPPSATTMAGLLASINAGTTISTAAVDKAVAGAGVGTTAIMGANVGFI